MKSPIEDYYLYRECAEGFEEPESCQQLRKEVGDLLELIQTLLPQEQKEKVELVNLLIGRLCNEKCSNAYKEGFKDGLRIACDTLTDK